MKILKIGCAALIAVTFLRPSIAQSQFDFADEAIDEIIKPLVGPEPGKEIMGLGLAIVHNGKIVYLKGYGFEDYEENVKVDPRETRFRWASISKTLTAATAVMADSTGQVELDKSVSLYYRTYKVPMYRMAGPNAWNVAYIPRSERTITMRMLLAHTSGIQHYWNGLSVPTPPPFIADNEVFNTGMQWALQYWASAPLRFKPGTQRSYSTFGYNLAGVVLEQGTGLPFEGLVQALVADPAGMTTLRADTMWDPAPRRAQGYIRDANNQWARQGDNDVSWKLAGGGFISTVQDMGRYAGALLEGDILDDDEMQTLFEQQRTIDGKLAFNGRQLLGWTRSGNVVSHGGAQAKGQCRLSLLRDIRGRRGNDTLAIAIMTNAGLAGMVDLEASGFFSTTAVDIQSIESQIRNLVQERVEDGEDAINVPSREIMVAEQNLWAKQKYYHAIAVKNSGSLRAVSSRKK